MMLSKSVKKVLIVNLWGKSFSGFSKGQLNKSFCDMAEQFYLEKGCEIKTTRVAEDYNVEDELAKYQWADLILYQSPVNWMGMSWEAKKYADEVWTTGMGGQLCNGDGRSKEAPEDNYGTGGTLNAKYILSLTLNAPKGSFDRPDQTLFEGKSVDDLWFPFHCNQKFFGLEQVPDSTFGSFDVMKNPVIEEDHERFLAHLQKLWN